MNNPWILCGIGALFCIIGVYLFFRNVYEEDHSIARAITLLVMGVILIAAGTAKYFKLL